MAQRSVKRRPARSGTREATERRFVERAAQARGQRLRRWLVALLVVAGLGALGWLLGFSTLLDVRTVEVTGAEATDEAAIERVAAREQGTPLARVDGSAVADRIAEEVPAVKSVDIDRGWPHTLNVNVTSRVPALAVREDDGFRLLDIEGVVIRTTSSAPKGVPTVRADDGAEVSGHGVRAARGMLKALPADMRDRVRGVTVDGADQVSFRLGRTTIVWGDAESPKVKVRLIPILLEKKPEIIDVSAPGSPVTTG
ncbi:FtsQ-type POTRA domain-containing protein [Janibacter sp. DB-40]|uniref:cell division protein FtsQ/DivIB n=1 Tax=Janibacter sp. DB-40 TaxID=3028808 RepID=UPI0024053503|nr:FtsQ-type POTRA domain-containing protein [Janibacter sp. DB-40]